MIMLLWGIFIRAEKAVEKEPENERLRANRDIIAQLSETL